MNTIVIINIARQQLGMDEDTIRALYVSGDWIELAPGMTEGQRIAVVDELKRLGFRVKTGGKTLPLSSKAYIRRSTPMEILHNARRDR